VNTAAALTVETAAEKFRFDVLLVDYNMPGLNSLDLLRELKLKEAWILP